MNVLPFTIASEIIEEKNLTKEGKDLYNKNLKLLKEEIEKETRKWKDILYTCIGRINFVKINISQIAVYRCSTIPTKIPISFFTGIGKSILNFIWNRRDRIWEMQSCPPPQNSGGVTILELKICGRAIAIKQYGTGTKQTCRPMEQKQRPTHEYHEDAKKYAQEKKAS